MIEIDKGVSIPAGKRGSKYPWENMEVGDSFFVPCEGKHKRSVGTYGASRGKRDGRKYRILALEGGVRIWRVE